jgi:hypothetical protein
MWVSNASEPIPKRAMEKLFEPFFRGDVRDKVISCSSFAMLIGAYNTGGSASKTVAWSRMPSAP